MSLDGWISLLYSIASRSIRLISKSTFRNQTGYEYRSVIFSNSWRIILCFYAYLYSYITISYIWPASFLNNRILIKSIGSIRCHLPASVVNVPHHFFFFKLTTFSWWISIWRGGAWLSQLIVSNSTASLYSYYISEMWVQELYIACTTCSYLLSQFINLMYLILCLYIWNECFMINKFQKNIHCEGP